MPDVIHHDHSTWLAKRAKEAAELGPPQPPEMVALPGAKAAIARDRLDALLDHGHDDHAIVANVNARWREANAQHLAAHKAWVHGPYVGAIEEMRHKALEAEAHELRRRALFEQILREREEQG
jgi:hypothetical protein